MVPPATQPRVREARRQRQEQERNRRRFAVVAAFSLVAIVTALLAAFGGSGQTPSAGPAPASASRLLPGGPPQPEIIANIGALHIQLPVDQSRVTALGYQGGSEGSLALSPVGTQANQGLLRRLARAIFGSSSGRPRWYQLPGGEGPATSSIDVGAAPGTDVYSPVDGTIVAIDDVVLNGSTLGSQVDIQPTVAPSLVISVSHISVDPGSRSARPSRRAARGSATCSTSRTPSSRRWRATRTTPVTTSSSRCTRRRPCRLRSDPELKILFVADVFGSAGVARSTSCCPACGRSSRSTSASSTARTPPPAAASRPRSPTSSSPGGPTSSRSATGRGASRASRLTCPAPTVCCGPRTCRPVRPAAG